MLFLEKSKIICGGQTPGPYTGQIFHLKCQKFPRVGTPDQHGRKGRALPHPFNHSLAPMLWTSAPQYFLASLCTCCTCLLRSSLPPDDMITSRMCCASYSGFLSGNESTTTSHALCTSCCLVWHRHIRLITSTLSPTAAAVFSDQQLTGHVLSHVHTTSNIFGDRSFAAASLRVWNNLASQLQADISHEQFKRQHNTFLFGVKGWLFKRVYSRRHT